MSRIVDGPALARVQDETRRVQAETRHHSTGRLVTPRAAENPSAGGPYSGCASTTSTADTDSEVKKIMAFTGVDKERAQALFVQYRSALVPPSRTFSNNGWLRKNE